MPPRNLITGDSGQTYWPMSRPIGRGASGEAVKATRISDNRIVAVKRQFRDLSRFEDETEMFLHALRRMSPYGTFGLEMLTLKTVAHPNIIRFIDHSLNASSFNIVMEYAEFGDLADFFLRKEFNLVTLALNMLHALCYLHVLHIMHRDIKPENILVCSRSPLVFKLSDFGLATYYHTRNGASTCCGTPGYMAPEIHQIDRLRALALCTGGPETQQRFNNMTYTEKADIWSLGAVLKSKAAQIHTSTLTNACHALMNEMTEDNADNRPSALMALQSPWCDKYSAAARSGADGYTADHLVHDMRRRIHC